MNGNPAQAEILKIAQQDVDNNREPSAVGKVVLREWCNWLRATRNHLELKSQLSDDEKVELQTICSALDRYGSV